jgi:chorismate mutase/prephenate dehydratase
MSDSGEDNAKTLKALRDRIDEIDAAMHRLLMERGTVIEALIRTKGSSRPGAAFRPMREAEMMRALATRHSGALPLATAEHIWREIITTFTRMQAPFNVAIDASIDAERMRDLARFVFGFAVEVVALDSAAAVIADVAAKGDLGLVARKARGPWWLALAKPKAPRIMALVPFIVVKGGPAGLPAFVIAPPLTDETAPDLVTFAVTADGPLHAAAEVEVLAVAVGPDGATEALLAAPSGVPVGDRLRHAAVKVQSVVLVGGFARGVAVGGSSTALYRAIETAGEHA